MYRYTFDQPFVVESGAVVHDLRLQYTQYGTLNAQGDNVIWVFHALTANADPAQWWPGIFGKGNLLDPEHYYIICVNMPGSCYGSSGPRDTDTYGATLLQRFPAFSIRDMVRAYQELRIALGIQKYRLPLAAAWVVCKPCNGR